MKPIAEMVRRWPSEGSRAWVERFIPLACSHPSVLAVVAFGAAVRTDHYTADIDLLVIYERPKPVFPGRPIDVDIRWYEKAQAEKFVQEGQELLAWVMQFGELICETDGYWTRLGKQWLGRIPFPSATVADRRVERAWSLYEQLRAVGDEDAADEQRLVALTQEARARLIRHGVYPASRSELPTQLRERGDPELANKLESALHAREFSDTLPTDSEPVLHGCD